MSFSDLVRRLCYARQSGYVLYNRDPGYRDRDTPPVLDAEPAGDSRDLLSEITPAIFHAILAWTPASALFMQIVSRRVGQNTGAFLLWYRAEIVRECAGEHAPLRELILRQLGPDNNSLRSALQFHLSVPPAIRSLDPSLSDCPNRILAPREINQFGYRIHLLRVWGRLRGQVLAARPGDPGIPALHAPTEEIRTWMRTPGNRTLVQGMDRLNLNVLHLGCFPEEMPLGAALQTLDLSQNQLFSLPAGPFQPLTALQELYLYNNRLASLPEGIFRGLGALRSLYLDNNQLSSVPEGLFQGLTALQTLTLCRNRLTSVPGRLFHGLTALQTLALSNNPLGSVPQQLFDGLTALKSLSLFNNCFTILPGGLFRGLTALEWLDLHENHLASVPGDLFQGLLSLHDLCLYNAFDWNCFRGIPEELFQGLTALRVLSLANNHLSVIPGGTFHGLTALLSLTLVGNELSAIPCVAFQGLTALHALYLGFNPRLLIFWNDLPQNGNQIELMQKRMRELSSYMCQFPLARVYQLAAEGAPPEAVRDSFSALPPPTKNALFGKVWEEAGRPEIGDPQWGEHHVFDDMQRFYGALKRYVKDIFAHLDDEQKNAVYGQVYQLALQAGNEDAADFDDLQWGEHHAFDNIPRLIDAMIRARKSDDIF